jgi:hypothetical protein
MKHTKQEKQLKISEKIIITITSIIFIYVVTLIHILMLRIEPKIEVALLMSFLISSLAFTLLLVINKLAWMIDYELRNKNNE